MGKKAKQLAKSVTNAVTNIPQTVADTVSSGASSVLNAGKALVGANGGNYFKGLGSAAVDLGTATANGYMTAATSGMTSLNDTGRGNNLDDQVNKVIGKTGDDGAVMPESVALDPAAEDPALAAERENAKKKGRASNILGGASDSLSNVSAKKSLLAL